MQKSVLEINWKSGLALRDHRTFHYDGIRWTESAQINPPAHPQALGTSAAPIGGTGRQGLYNILRHWLALYGKNKGEQLSIGATGYLLEGRLPSMTLRHLGDEFFYATFRKSGDPVRTTCLREVMDLVEKTFPAHAPRRARDKKPGGPAPAP